MRPGIDPKVDYAFKRVFGCEHTKPLLLHLLNAVLQYAAGQELVALELLNPFNEKETAGDKLSILDIKARDQQGRQYNIEMQMLPYDPFRHRAVYYLTKFHPQQLQEGMDYSQLRPTISICIVNRTLFEKVSDYHLVFELRERKHPLVFSDQLSLHLLELLKFTKTAEELTTPLDMWLYFMRHGEELDTEALPPPLSTPEVHQAVMELVMLTQSDVERNLYELRRKSELDIVSALRYARDEGRSEGMKQARIGEIHSLQRLLKQAPTAPELLVAQTLEQLDQLADQLTQQVAQQLAGAQ